MYSDIGKSILNSIKLYLNYNNIIEKMNKKKYRTKNEKYYLINKNSINQMKIDNNYEEIKTILEANGVKKNDEYNIKKMLSLFKSFPDIYFDKETKKDNLKGKYRIENYEPDIIPVNYFDKTENTIMIYNNFELFEKEIIGQFIYDIYEMDSYYLECTLNEEKIIIHYDEKLNGNNKFISIIGILDNDNTFVTEYILIYKNKKEQINHLRKISGSLNKYLNGLQLYNNSEPIIDYDYREIGVIIKYEKNNSGNDNFSMNDINQQNINYGNNQNEINAPSDIL